MRRRHAVPIALLGALAGASTWAAGEAAGGDFWVAPTAFVCLEQDGAYRQTPLGADIARNPSYQKWRASEGDAALACIAGKKLMPAELCTAVFSMDAKGDPNAAARLYDKWHEAIDGLQRIGECDAPAAH